MQAARAITDLGSTVVLVGICLLGCTDRSIFLANIGDSAAPADVSQRDAVTPDSDASHSVCRWTQIGPATQVTDDTNRWLLNSAVRGRSSVLIASQPNQTGDEIIAQVDFDGRPIAPPVPLAHGMIQGCCLITTLAAGTERAAAFTNGSMTRIDPDSGWPVGLPARIGFDVFWPDADEPEGFSALTHDGDGIRLVVMRPDGSVVSSVSLVPNERQFQRSFHGRVVRSDRSFALRWNDLAGLNVRVFDARGRALGPAVFLPLAGDSAAAVMAVTRNGYVLGSRRDSATLQTLLFDTTGTPSTESIGFETSTPVEQVIPYHVDTSALAVASYGDELLFGYPASTGSQPAYFLQPLDAQGRPRGTSLRLELPVWVRMARLLTTPTGVVAVLEAARTEPTDGSYVLRMGVWAAGFRCER